MLSEKASTKNPNKVAEKIPVYKSWIGDLGKQYVKVTNAQEWKKSQHGKIKILTKKMSWARIYKFHTLKNLQNSRHY